MTIAFTSEPTEVRTAAQGAEYALGTPAWFAGRMYRYVKNGAAAVHAKGAPAWAMSATVLWTIGKVANIVSAVETPLGACPAIPTLGFGWMFCVGGCLPSDGLCLGDGSIAAGEALNATDDTFDTVSAVDDNIVCGSAIVADDPMVGGYFTFFGS